MTADPNGTASDAGRHPLAPGALPEAIRAALLDEDRAAFDAALVEASETARRTADRTSVSEVLEQWRRIAVLQADPDRFARLARRVAELRTGVPVPADEPLDVTRSKAGMKV